jgi:anti-sigma factor RsiW
MRNQHITHLITRYVHGQLRPSQRARVINHVRMCAACRAALAREELIASDLRREMPGIGTTARSAQFAQVWAGVWQEVGGRRGRFTASAWLPGLGAVIALVLILAMVAPLVSASGLRDEAALQQPRPVSTASPTPGMIETSEARAAGSSSGASWQVPAVTVAFVSGVGATPAPVPQATVSPEVRLGTQ